jgi:EmrB/QacA subfamily drug resistance transporter
MSDPERPPEPPSYATERHPHLRVVIPAIVAVAFIMEQLDSTVIVTALPAMAESLHTTPLRLNLAITAYVLALAMFIPLSGWLADRFGSRRIFALSLLVFTIGSVLCGVATSFEMLIATRTLQGIGGAMMTPVGRLILIRSFPRSQLATAMAYVTYPAVVGPVLGPLVGGFFTTYLSWRWIFLINIPFGLLGMLAALRYVDDDEGDRSARFDFTGFILVGSGFALLQLGLENLGRGEIATPIVTAILAVAALLLVGFVFYALRASAPAVDIRLFAERAFRVATVFGGLCRVGFNGVPFLLPLLLQLGFGLSPLMSGALICVLALPAIPIRWICVHVLRRCGFRATLVASSIAGAAAISSFALLQPSTPHWIIVAITLIFGATRSLQFMSSNMLAFAEVNAGKLSRATSLAGALQQLSVSFGVSLSAIVLTAVVGHGATPTPAHFHIVFPLVALVPLLAIPGFLTLNANAGEAVILRRRQKDAGRGDGPSNPA